MIKPENSTTKSAADSDSDDLDTRVEMECKKTLIDAISLDLLGPPGKSEDMPPPPGRSLCALTYTHVSPLSPEHPAMRDLETQEVCVERLEGEPNIHRINLQCTAIDAIGTNSLMLILYMYTVVFLPPKLILYSGGVCRALTNWLSV